MKYGTENCALSLTHGDVSIPNYMKTSYLFVLPSIEIISLLYGQMKRKKWKAQDTSRRFRITTNKQEEIQRESVRNNVKIDDSKYEFVEDFITNKKLLLFIWQSRQIRQQYSLKNRQIL